MDAMEPPVGPHIGRRLSATAGISQAARDLLSASEVIDLHLESFISARLLRYDLTKRHDPNFPFFGNFFGHADLPRILSGGLTGCVYSIATNITRTGHRRASVLTENIDALDAVLRSVPGIEIVRDHAEYRAARGRGHHAAMIAVQGGNAFDGVDLPNDHDRRLTRVTLVHLSNSTVGTTSSPVPGKGITGLTKRGKDHVAAYNAQRVFVDLAHASPRTFWDALDVHDRTLPPIVTHTGIKAAYSMWRNLDDDQVRAIAERGGVVGIIFHRGFLAPWSQWRRTVDDVVRHIVSAINIGGEDAVAIGTDLDGFILPPPGLNDIELAFGVLVEALLRARVSERAIQKLLGANYLRSFAALRPGTAEATAAK